MDMNFKSLLLSSINKNKDKYLGILRRNGVLVKKSIPNAELANIIIKAMNKSEAFKREVLLAVTVMEKETMMNFTGADFSSGIGWTPQNGGLAPATTTGGFSTTSSATTTGTPPLTPTATTQNAFEKYLGVATNLFEKYKEAKELDVRSKEADVVLATAPLPVQAPKSNTVLYVVFGVLGTAMVGALIYFATKKK